MAQNLLILETEGLMPVLNKGATRMEIRGNDVNGVIKFDNLTVYLVHRQPPQQICFVLSDNIQGFGSVCEKNECLGKCKNLDCPGLVKTEISEIVSGSEASKVLKFSYSDAGKLWLWLGPAFRKRLNMEGKLYFEVLYKENLDDSVIVTQLEISETKEIIAGYNITGFLKQRNRWNEIEIPLGLGGFDLSWHNLQKSGTLTFVLKIVPINGEAIKGNLYLKSLSFK